MATSSNPYLLHKEWSPEIHQAYQSMPRNSQGHIVSMLYLEGRELERMEPLWREWCKRTPKHLWPSWIPTYAQRKNLSKRSTDLNGAVNVANP